MPKKNENVDEGFLSRRFRHIARMAPDVSDVLAATLGNPLAGLGVAAKKIAEKAKAETKMSQSEYTYSTSMFTPVALGDIQWLEKDEYLYTISTGFETAIERKATALPKLSLLVGVGYSPHFLIPAS